MSSRPSKMSAQIFREMLPVVFRARTSRNGFPCWVRRSRTEVTANINHTSSANGSSGMGILPFMTYQGFEVELRKPFSIYHFPFDICYPVDWVARSSLPLACFPLNQMENHRCQMKNGKWFFVCQLTKSERTSSN